MSAATSVLIGVASAVPFFVLAAAVVAWQPVTPRIARARAVACPRVRARLGLVA